MSKILLTNNYLHCEDFSGSIKIDTEKNQMSIFNIKLQKQEKHVEKLSVVVEKRTQEPFLEDYCNDIPELPRQIEIYRDEEISKTPSGPIAPRALKPLQKANLSRKEKTEKRKIEIREGLIKYLESKGGKHVISCNCSDKSTPEKKNEVEEVHKFTSCKDAKSIRRERNNLVEAGIIRQINLTDKKTTYKLVTEKPQEEQKNEKPRSVCPKCGSLALVRNEKKYQSDEERWTDKNGYFFTCLMCGEELEDDELQEAA